MIENIIRKIYNSNEFIKDTFQKFCKNEVVNDINENPKNNVSIVVKENRKIVSIDQNIIDRKRKTIDMNHTYHLIDEIKKYTEKNNKLPPQRLPEIGWFVRKQRDDYNNGTILPEIKDELEKIPLWTWTPLDTEFENNLENLEEFIIKNNKLPNSVENRKLFDFCKNYKQKYQNDNLDNFTYKTINELCSKYSINFEWNGKMNEEWNKKFQLLCDYYDKYDAFPDYKTEIGRWIYEQAKTNRNNKLKKERKEILTDKFGNKWELPPSKRKK